MTATITVQCPRCGNLSTTEYRLVGSPMTCTNCLQGFLAEPAQGVQIPDTGRELSFTDFMRILQETETRRAISPMLKQWYGYRITGKGEGMQILDAKSIAVPILSVHLKIQNSEDNQRSLYQTAMSFWR